MTEQQAALMVLKGFISEAPADVRAKVTEAADKVRALVAEYGDEGRVALALVVGEMEAQS